jgi:hypothetical protein
MLNPKTNAKGERTQESGVAGVTEWDRAVATVSTRIRSFSVPILKIKGCVAVADSATPATPDS